MLFELDAVVLHRAGSLVLDQLSARIPAGASCLAGPSGSGKSTTLRLLNRLADPESGTVLYRGEDVRERDPLDPPARGGAGAAAAGAARGNGGRQHPIRRRPRRARARRRATARPRRARRLVRRPRLGPSLGRRAAAGDARPGAGARAERAAARRADLGARRGGHGARSSARSPSFASGSRSRPCSSPTTSPRLGGCPTGWCGSKPAARSPRGRPKACSRGSPHDERGRDPRDARRGRREPGARRDRDRGLALATDRARGRHRDCGGPLGDPADRGRLRDPGDLRRRTACGWCSR